MNQSIPPNVPPGRFVESEVGFVDRTGLRTSSTVRAFIPSPLPPPHIDWRDLRGRLYHLLVETRTALARVDEAASALPQGSLIARPLLLREARNSSAIEDTHASASELGLAIAGEHSNESVREVHNYLTAIDHAACSELPFSPRLMRELHALLLEGVRGGRDHPGKLRTSQNFIGRAGSPENARFVPPPPTEVESTLHQLCEFMNPPAEPGEIPPLARIALSHYQFEAIHPFNDGNGRIGRLLACLAIVRTGLVTQPVAYLSGALESRRREYVDLLLAVSREGAWEEWIEFFVECVRDEARRSMATVRELSKISQELSNTAASISSTTKLQSIVDALFAAPVTTVKSAAEAAGITPAMARRHLLSLEEAGVLCRLDTPGTKLWFYAPRILLVIEDQKAD